MARRGASGRRHGQLPAFKSKSRLRYGFRLNPVGALQYAPNWVQISFVVPLLLQVYATG